MVKVEDLSRLIRNIRHNSLVFKPHSLSLPELFIPFSELVRPATTPFYAKLDQTLASFDFATRERERSHGCPRADDRSGGRQPPDHARRRMAARQLLSDRGADSDRKSVGQRKIGNL